MDVLELWDKTADAQGCLEQSTSWTCYPASAVMLLHHHGIRAGEGEMAYRANTTFFGTEEYTMARALTAMVRARGWYAVAEWSDYEACVRRDKPFIAHVVPPELGEEHAVFIRKVGRKFVVMIDPLDGVARRYARADFEAIWVGMLVRLVTDVQRR
jgi:ABC-type bacteriocin/lantibiotic exporter with double-glycine peptidase domain